MLSFICCEIEMVTIHVLDVNFITIVPMQLLYFIHILQLNYILLSDIN